MTTINELAGLDELSPGDSIPIYSRGNQIDRRVSFQTLTDATSAAAVGAVSAQASSVIDDINQAGAVNVAAVQAASDPIIDAATAATVAATQAVDSATLAAQSAQAAAVSLNSAVKKVDLAAADGATQVGIKTPGLNTVLRTVADNLGDVVNANNYTSIQAALTAAGTSGCVIVPGNCTHTGEFVNPNNIAILDLRKGNIGIHSWLQPAYPADGYPQGHDLALRSSGPADTYLEKFKTAAVTASPLVVGANPAVTVGAVPTGNARAGNQRTGDTGQYSLKAGLYIGRNTANEEYVNIGQWSIVNDTTLSITCTKAHAAPVDIEQVGSTLLISPDLYIQPISVGPTNGAYSPSLKVKDLHGTPMVILPGNMDPTAGIHSYVRWTAIQSGENGVNKDYIVRHQLTTSSVLYKDSTGSTFLTIDGVGQITATRGLELQGAANLAGTAGAVQIGKTSAAITSTTDVFFAWQNSNDPLNSSGTAGGLLLASRNIANTTINLATQNTLRAALGATGLRVVAGFGCNGKTPQAAVTVNAAATDAASTQALVNQLRALLVANGIAI